MSTDKKTYPIENVLLAQAVLREFNALDLNSTQLTEKGKPIVVDPIVRKNWEFVGFGNSMFVELRAWEDEELKRPFGNISAVGE